MSDFSLKLISMDISGFQGVPPDKNLSLESLGHRNVFIGQNDAGKSLPLRLLLMFVRAMIQQPNLVGRVGLGDFHSDSVWQQDKSSEVRVDLGFQIPDAELEGQLRKLSPNVLLVKNRKWMLRGVVQFRENHNNGTLELMPLAEVNGSLVASCKMREPNAIQIVRENGDYGDDQSAVWKTFREALTTPFVEWLQGCRFFDPLRAVGRPSKHGSQLIEDGSSLVTEMKTLKDNPATMGEFDSWEADVCEKLAKLFNPPFSTLDVRGQNPEIYLKKLTNTARFVPLKHMGTGVQQMIIAYSRLVRDRGKHKTYFIEEPETNLHPKLLRTFVRDLAEYKSIQFFITTHSSVLLDSLEDGDKVYFFTQDATGACSAKEAANFVSQHSVLDALGVTGSSLLQTNCVVWVEGPSDRLYIRQWLNEYSNGQGRSLQEGIDYSFLFYGGSILSHFEFESTDEDVKEFVSLLKISRFSAVIMDQNGHLNTNQIRILEEAGKDDSHRFVRHTDAREIENDVNEEVFLFSVADYLVVPRDSITDLKLEVGSRYMTQIAKHITSDPAEIAKIERKLSRKVDLAMKVIAVGTREKMTFGCPTYVKPLFDFIVASRLDH